MKRRRWLPSRFQLAMIGGLMGFLIPLLWVLLRHYQFSWFYRLDPARFSEWPRARRAEARLALSEMEAWARARGLDLPLFDRPSARRLCVGVVSVRRDDARDEVDGEPLEYLGQTIAGLLTRVPWSHQDRLRLTLYNVDGDPGAHREAVALSRLVRTVSPDYQKLVGMGASEILQRGGVIWKENLDYQAALQHQLSLGCEYSLLLEDDSLAAPGWYEEVERILAAIPADTPWHYTKLYTTLMFEGYQNSLASILEFVGTTVGMAVGLFVAVAVVLLLVDLATTTSTGYEKLTDGIEGGGITSVTPLPSPLQRPSTTPFSLSRRWFLEASQGQLLLMGILAGLVVAAVGRQNIRYSPYAATIAHKHLYPSPICISSQAVLYPRSQVALLDRYLTAHRHPRMLAKDLHWPGLQAEHARQQTSKEAPPLQTYSWLPDAFQHIGLYSTLRVHQHSLAEMKYSTHYRHDQTPIRFDPRMNE